MKVKGRNGLKNARCTDCASAMNFRAFGERIVKRDFGPAHSNSVKVGCQHGDVVQSVSSREDPILWNAKHLD
jgi:hypothetical protein